jgi:hypothetical protein
VRANKIIFSLFVIAILLLLGLFSGILPGKAQSTVEPIVWRAQVVDVVPNAVLSGGAILRVHVKDRPGDAVEVRQIETVLHNTTGTKPEYGPDVAEFAPLPAGRWLITVPALDVSMALQTDDRSLFVVEFAPVPASQATAEAQGSATPTPLGGTLWEGKQVSVSQGPSVAGAWLRVKVAGLAGLPVDIATVTDFIGQGITGSKAEYAADEVEFAGLSPGQYIITPHGLNARIVVDLQLNSTTFVEFSPLAATPTPPPTATATRIPPTPTARPTNTPAPTATPLKRWLALVEDRSPVGQVAPKLIVEIDALPDEVFVIRGGVPEQEATCEAGDQAESGRYYCQVDDLTPGRYSVTWARENLVVPLELSSSQQALIVFRQELAPPETTIWQAQMTESTVGPLPADRSESVVTVQFDARFGQPVSLVNSRRQRRLCETDADGICRFPHLEAGVYAIEPANVAVSYALYLDGQGHVQVNFEELPLSSAIAPTPIAGQGARPRVQPTPTPSNTPSPTPVPPTFTPRPVTPPPPRPTPTATPLPPPTFTPTPALAWFGTVAESYDHPGQTLVVRAPLGDHPVIIKSGPWQAEGRTGSKLEYGDGAVEFSGLSPGEYIIVLVNLAEFRVTLPPNHFMLAQFVYGPAPTPTPTARPGQWTSAIVSNTSGSEPGGGVWSILTVEIGGVNNLPVRISTDGFETECLTGSKPELGDGVCQIGGLWPATYRVQPAGLPVGTEVTLDGRGAAWVAFWLQ